MDTSVDPASPKAGDPTTGEAPASRIRIALLSQDPEVAARLAAFFPPDGYQLTCVFPGQDLIEYLILENPDLVILCSPARTGDFTLDHLRLIKKSQAHHLALIVVGPMADQELSFKALQAGADLYLTLEDAPTLMLAQAQSLLQARLDLQKGLILIVDDSPTARQVLMMKLSHEGYETEEASGGLAALTILEEKEPDLIILDLRMPGLDGFETCRAIRQQERLRQIPILFLTGEEDRSEVIRALNEGASDYVSKKADFMELHARVRAHIRNKKLVDEINRRKTQVDYLYQQLSRRNKAIQEELELARDVQNMMLPTDFSRIFPGQIGVSALFIPTQNISGDFYDVFPLNSEEMVFLMADVAGHGVPAALISSMAKVLVQNLARRYEWPHEVALGLNQELIRSLEHHMVTLFYGVYNVKTRKLRYTNAGHPPALLYRRGRSDLAELFTGNPVSGVFPTASYDTKESELAPGDRLVIYTDGITEAYNADAEPFSPERLKEIIVSCAAMKMEALKKEVVTRCRRFTGKDAFVDDISLLMIDIL